MYFVFNCIHHFHSESRIDTPYYDLPPVRSSRAAGFGYARKFDFSKIVIGTPAPNTYRVEGRSLSTNKGITFGMSRAVSPTDFINLNLISPENGEDRNVQHRREEFPRTWGL